MPGIAGVLCKAMRIDPISPAVQTSFLPGDVCSLKDLTAGRNWFLNRKTKSQHNDDCVFLNTPCVGDSDANIATERAQTDFCLSGRSEKGVKMATEMPRMIAGVRIPTRDSHDTATWFSRLWLAMPEWCGQAAGALAMFVWLGFEIPAYFSGFWTLGAWYEFADGTRINLPWTRVLVDLNILLVGLAFVFRRPAQIRAARAGDVLLSLLGGWWPILPFLTVAALARFEPFVAAEWQMFIQRPQMNFPQVFGGASLIMLGNALDLSGYATLFRSFSVVPEARELKTTGLYRFVRHPVYLGQFISQAGVWLVFALAHWFWWSFYGLFIVLQLWRTKREDAVLERAFGNEFREWKERTFWFV